MSEPDTGSKPFPVYGSESYHGSGLCVFNSVSNRVKSSLVCEVSTAKCCKIDFKLKPSPVTKNIVSLHSL